MMSQVWKKNWAQTQEHFAQWWDRKGLVLGSWGPGLPTTKEHEAIPEPKHPDTPRERQTSLPYVAENIRWKMAHRAWPADVLPAAWPHLGTLPLAACLGATPDYGPNNVWYHAVMEDLETHPPLKYDPHFPEAKLIEDIVRASQAVTRGNFFLGMPAFLGGIDILAELRGTSNLMLDFIDNPVAVHKRLREIQDAYYVAFDRFYDIIKLPDGSMCYGYFMLYGQGKTALCQCDSALMISPKMFGEFVIPYLKEQVAFLDHSMFHVDGSQCLMHLDQLLALDDLDAIEFTPEPQVPNGGDPCWYELYKRILKAGKSLWVANLRKHEVIPLLDAIGGKGVNVNVNYINDEDGQELEAAIEKYRGQ